MAKQTRRDRERRLEEGCCPIHGLGMGQVDGWYYMDEEGQVHDATMMEAESLKSMNIREEYTIVGCPRRDCDIRATATGPASPCKLLPKWAYILDDA